MIHVIGLALLLGGLQRPASPGQVQAIVTGSLPPTPVTLAKIPISQASINTANAIGATAIFQNGILYNTDGSATGLTVVVPNVTGDTQIVSERFYGTSFGVRFLHSASTNFTVDVDGKLYQRVNDPDQFRSFEGLIGPYNYEVSAVTHTGLDPFKLHVAHFTFHLNTTTVLTGFLVDANSASVVPIVRASQVSTQVSLPFMSSGGLTPVFLSPSASLGQSAAHSINGVDQEIVSNFSSSPATVFFCQSGLTVSAVSNGNSGTAATIATVSAHGLVDHEPVILSNLTGTVSAGTYAMTIPAFALVTGYSTTTFGLFQDAACTVPIYCTGAYASGGVEYTLTALFSVGAGASVPISFPRPISPAGWLEFASGPGLVRIVTGATY